MIKTCNRCFSDFLTEADPYITQPIGGGYVFTCTCVIAELEAKNVELENKLNNPLCTSFLYESRVNELEKKLEIAVSAMKSSVGFEPFNSLNPRPISEALAAINGEGV